MCPLSSRHYKLKMNDTFDFHQAKQDFQNFSRSFKTMILRKKHDWNIFADYVEGFDLG